MEYIKAKKKKITTWILKALKMRNAVFISTTKVTFKEIFKEYLKVSLKRYCYAK